MSNQRKEPVSFGSESVPTAQSDRLRKAVTAAKKNRREKPSEMANTPHFDNLPIVAEEKPPPGFAPREELSSNTAAGLEALARAQPTPSSQAPEYLPEEEEESEEALTAEEHAQAAENRMRKSIEARLPDIDIGEFFSNGRVSQEVEILPGYLTILFRSVTGLEEGYVDVELAEKKGMTQRQFLRFSNELAVAMHVQSYNGTKWPEIFDAEGNINPRAVEVRLQNVRRIPSPVWDLVLSNLQWFLERMQSGLSVVALGNG